MCFSNRKLGNDIIVRRTEVYENDNENKKDIYDDDGEFMDAEKTNGSYYIGLAGYVENQSEPILLSSISANAFLMNGHYNVLEYLTEYSTSRVATPKLDILKLCIDDRQTYNVIIKTHWLRLVQRKWKKIYNARVTAVSCADVAPKSQPRHIVCSRI